MHEDTPTRERAFSVRRVEPEPNRAALVFEGRIAFPEAASLWQDARSLSHAPSERLDLDLSAVETIDGGSVALLVQLHCDLECAGRRSAFVGAEGQVSELLALYGGENKPCLRAAPRVPGLLDQVGAAVQRIGLDVKTILAFIGELLVSALDALKRPATVRWRDVAPLMERAGADGLVIVVLINLMVGFIMAFQGANAFKMFSANILVADLVGLSMTRELAPLMTAIIVCGRSGAAFAAELGTMKVSEEIDALQTLGFDPMRFLVFPRTLALLLVVPLLTVIADVVSIAGGLLVGITELDLTVVEYMNRTREALGPGDVLQGVLKSMVFALAIGLIACQKGLSTRGGATGVGRSTTAAVVTTLLALILIDAAFTVAFYAFGL